MNLHPNHAEFCCEQAQKHAGAATQQQEQHLLLHLPSHRLCASCLPATQDTRPGGRQALSPTVLECVLRQLHQATRLGVAARVCRAWRTAAIAASTDIKANLGGPDASLKQHSLARWIAAHSSAVTAVHVEAGGSSDPIVLPYQHLGHLQKCSFSKCSLEEQHVGVGSSSSPLSSFKWLTALQLDSVSVPSLLTLTALTRLQQLGLRDVTCADAVLISSSGQSHGYLCLRPLTRLTSIRLEPLSMFPAGAGSVFSSLQPKPRLYDLQLLQGIGSTNSS
jgi:hypothetical protein